MDLAAAVTLSHALMKRKKMQAGALAEICYFVEGALAGNTDFVGKDLADKMDFVARVLAENVYFVERAPAENFYSVQGRGVWPETVLWMRPLPKPNAFLPKRGISLSGFWAKTEVFC